MNRLLMIAYLFPPVGGIGSAGSQRALKFAKYLPEFGWKPVILTVRPELYEAHFTVDASLAEKVPSGIAVIRTSVWRGLTRLLLLKQCLKRTNALPAVTQLADPIVNETSRESRGENSEAREGKDWYQRMKDGITDLFEIPDEESGWLVPAVWRGWLVARQADVEIIFSTGRPWTAHVIGLGLKMLTGKRFIADFRDPWITNPFRLRYSWLKEIAERLLERKVIEHADVVVANTEELRKEFMQRFPAEPAGKFVSILNGFDPDDCAGVLEGDRIVEEDNFVVTHTGFLYGKRDPRLFLDAVKQFVEQPTVTRRLVRVCFLGSAELPYNLRDYLVANNLSDVVQLHDHVPFKQSLEFMRRSTLLLILQPGTVTQVPSKLFEYIGMQKPILAVSPVEGATSAIIRGEGVGEIVGPDDIPSMVLALNRFYGQWQAGEPLSATYEQAYQKFNVRNMTGYLAKQFR